MENFRIFPIWKSNTLLRKVKDELFLTETHVICVQVPPDKGGLSPPLFRRDHLTHMAPIMKHVFAAKKKAAGKEEG